MPCAEVWRKVIKEVQDDALRTALLSDGHEETCECLLCHTYKTIITKRDAAIPNIDDARSDLLKTMSIVADWLERSHQINPADMVARNLELAKELRLAAMLNADPRS